MKVLLILAIGILTNLNNVYATNVAAGVAIYPTVEEVGQGAADVYWYNVISGVSTTTTTRVLAKDFTISRIFLHSKL